MTKNYEDAGIVTGASLEMDERRTAEAATSVTKDTGKPWNWIVYAITCLCDLQA